MRAVIWADVFQCVCMVGGMVAILIKVSYSKGKKGSRLCSTMLKIIAEVLHYTLL